MRWSHAERERVIEAALSAGTLREIAAAAQDLRQWVRDQPGDLGIVDAFEVLSHKLDFAEQAQGSPSESGDCAPVGRVA